MDKNDYEPIVMDVGELNGIALNSAKEGEQVRVLRRFFFNTYEINHIKFFDKLLKPFIGEFSGDLNKLIVLVRDKKAFIYKDFPFATKIKPKVDVKKHHAVFENQILDIVGVEFKDMFFELEIRDSDKFLWLFRSGWNFGLYFDFTEKLNSKEISGKLADCYKRLKFYELYNFLSSGEKFDRILEEGWFPFAQIIGEEFDRLRYAENELEFNSATEIIIESFSRERIDSFSQYWWRNKVFNSKREILEAGLNAFLLNNPAQTINCIKNLLSEIEGIIRLEYHLSHSKSPTTNELKAYILKSGEVSFPNENSLGFPSLFYRYLSEVIFKGFNVETGEIPLSRHSVSHGVARSNDYSRVKALQLILTLDQIYFYFGSRSE